MHDKVKYDYNCSYFQISKASRTTSRSVRIHERPKSPPEVPHSPIPPQLDSTQRRYYKAFNEKKIVNIF